MWSGTCTDSLKLPTYLCGVMCEVRFLFELFATPWTHKWLLPCVNPHVFFKEAVYAKDFVTNLTQQWPQSHLFVPMVNNQIGFPLVTNTTVYTLELPFLYMLNLV